MRKIEKKVREEEKDIYRESNVKNKERKTARKNDRIEY